LEKGGLKKEQGKTNLEIFFPKGGFKGRGRGKKEGLVSRKGWWVLERKKRAQVWILDWIFGFEQN